jgi:hypothetical protein
MATLERDAIWRDAPNPAPACDHDYRRLPVVEFRQTVTCAKCGGLSADLSRAITANPAAYLISDDGAISAAQAP